jgi:hypothetical protein
LFALKWSDFNWHQLTMLVQRAIVDAVVGNVKTRYSQSGLPLDPALADVLYGWKRASQFGRDHDWVFASAHMAGELPLRMKQDVGETDQAGRGCGPDWVRRRMAYVPPHLLVNVAPTRSGFQTSARTSAPGRPSNYDERVYTRRQRTEALRSFQRCVPCTSIEQNVRSTGDWTFVDMERKLALVFSAT